MKIFLKWFGIVSVIIAALILIVEAARYIYEPQSHAGWVKPGIAQAEIPAGVDTPVVFENVTVIPMNSERLLKRQSVVIKDGRIAVIGSSGEVEIPADAHIVDGVGKFLIPGLSDMHMHTFAAENDLLVYLANGVTTIRTMGAESSVVLKWRDQIRTGTRVGPSIWVWWPLIVDHAPYREWEAELSAGGGRIFVHTPEEAEQLVTEMAAKGVDGIKAHDIRSSEIYKALLKTADRYGLPLDGHIPKDHTYCPDNKKTECVCATKLECWNDFRAMGVSAVAHLEELIKIVEWSDKGIQKAARDAADDGLWVTTTAYLMRSIADQAADLESTLAELPEVKYVHPRVFNAMGWGLGSNDYVKRIKLPQFFNYIAAVEKMLLALNKSGALLMSGTDAPIPVMVPGFSLHDEFKTMADVGLSSYDILKTSTYNPALYLGKLKEFGTVEAGKRADLVLLEGNPLEDIANTRQIVGTMVRGRWYSRTDLDLMLEAVVQDYEAVKTNQKMVEIAFPIVVVLLLFALGWFIVSRVRRRR